MIRWALFLVLLAACGSPATSNVVEKSDMPANEAPAEEETPPVEPDVRVNLAFIPADAGADAAIDAAPVESTGPHDAAFVDAVLPPPPPPPPPPQFDAGPPIVVRCQLGSPYFKTYIESCSSPPVITNGATKIEWADSVNFMSTCNGYNPPCAIGATCLVYFPGYIPGQIAGRVAGKCL